MARKESHVRQMLKRIEQMSEVEQCELLEAMLLGQRRAELGWAQVDQIRAKLPRRSERQVKRDSDTAIRQVRRDLSRRSSGM